ncbi:bifunctional lysylphosphatidylglycerol flippase/synthetase MprF [Neobacillus sp. LXY-4]|uniref:bifunctional lysylphosphatidylglycerol flippase/synthetase MprF n=1 Tax=Neobacillus sp. LXY-4 TaxID=3379826 RepID=UPI003EE36FBC
MLKRNNLLRLLKILIPILFIILIGFEGKQELQNIDPSRLLLEMKSITFTKLATMFFLGFIAVATMSLYDLILVKKLNIHIPLLKLFKYSWIANTFNNIFGFGGFTGAGLRGSFYKKYTNDTRSLVSSIVWVTPFLLTGLSILAWLPIFDIVSLARIYSNHPWIFYLICGMALYLPGYLVVLYFTRKKGHGSSWSKWNNYAILASLVEWLFAAILLWGISHVLGSSVPFRFILGVFLAAAATGTISLVPGGLGSFDLMMLIGMHYYGVDEHLILMILLFYRVFYYLVPFIIGLIFASTEAAIYTKSLLLNSKFGPFLTRYNYIPEKYLSNLSHWALAILVFFSGIILLVSAATPGVLVRMKFAEKLLSVPILHLSHQLSVTAGISLLLLSRSIQLKVKNAYQLTYFILIVGAIFTFSKGFDFEEAFFLIGIALLLKGSKKRFYREGHPLSFRAFLIMSALMIGSMLTYISIGYLDQPYAKIRVPMQIKDLLVKQPTDLLFSAVIGFVFAIIFNLLGFRFLAGKTEPLQLKVGDLNEFLKNHKGNELTHLGFLGDKQFFWSENFDVVMLFSKVSDKLVVLGDPIGNPASFPKAIDELQQYADIKGLTPVFYQVKKEWLPLYHEYGYQFFKLGEEAYVDLDEFNLTGKKKATLRAIKNKFIREEYMFQIIEPPFSEEFITNLKIISDEWLGKRMEKGFSLGFFDPNYIQKAPVAILTAPNGSILAFVTIMPSYDKNNTISIDLMRHLNKVPNGAMDMIMISLMQYGKEQGYKWFNLGMAPLSNVGKNKHAFFDEKVASKIYEHGNYFYQFEGVRKYKEKFASRWEPKYLAFRKRTSLPITMLQLLKLISKAQKKGTEGGAEGGAEGRFS